MEDKNDNKDNTVYITSQVNEIFASTELVQFFTNPLDNAIELTIFFPIKEEINLSKFVVSMDDKIILSKILPKEKAEEKYNDSVASGNVGVLSKYEEKNDAYSVNIGNLQTKKQIKLTSIFIQMIGAKDISYEFIMMEKYPSFYYKELENNKGQKNKIIKANFEIKALSKITRLIAPFYDENAKKYSKFNVKYSQDYKTAKIEYSKFPEEIKDNNKNKINYPNSSQENNVKESFNSIFSILFRTENMNKPLLCTQYNPELKETAYSINYIYCSKYLKEIPVPEKPDEDNTISYSAKYEDNIINETPGLFIFLIDQSGSMSGDSIELVKKSLILFIQSLPEKSYFQLIGFGSNFKKYNEEPVIYNKENVNNIIEIINNLDANLGGTNISGPLDAIFRDDNYSKINLSKNIFLLTDGKVYDSERCFELINNNSGKFRIHSLGIGNYFDKVLIEKCGKLGKGTSSFVKEVDKINSVVIDVLNKSLRPYIIDIKFEFDNYKEEIAANIISCYPKNNFSYQNEIMNYSFILPEKKELNNLKLKITGLDPINIIEENINFENLIKLEDGEEMGKMIVGKALKNNEEFQKDEEKEIKFAKKYQILSKNTALFAEIINEESQQSKLIKVELKQSQEKTDPFKHSFINLAQLNAEMSRQGASFNFSLKKKIITCDSSRPSYSKKSKKKSAINFDFFGGISKKIKGLFQSKETSPSSSDEKKESKMEEYSAPIKEDYKINSNYSNNISENKKEEPKFNFEENKNKKDDNTKLLIAQDIIEGSWNENDETKKLVDIISSEKFEKIKNKIIPLNKGENETKIIYTILVVYYLKTIYAKDISEYRLVINKANKFLQKNGINYDNIISGI